MRPKLTYANVVATLALFIAIGGTSAFAASQLGKNSVGAKQLKKNSVTTAKIKSNAVTAAKVKSHTLTGSDINLNKLGTVPNARHAASADAIPPAEPVHIVGAPGEPAFEVGNENYSKKILGLSPPPVGFYKDGFGIVHLEGIAVSVGLNPHVFTLPPGYRPASGTVQSFEQAEKGPVGIVGSAVTGLPAGAVFAGGETVFLNGITFRAGS